MHYRLFYALYLFENSSVAHYGDLKAVTKGGQQSITNYRYYKTRQRGAFEHVQLFNRTLETIGTFLVQTDVSDFYHGRSDTVVKLTHEQLRIVNHNVQAGEVIKIIAFAGH
uniref:Uncharacterized protein n=1 Tax=Magallana gigas TaxID=29159 RepID=K1P807_MAGGI